MKVRGTQQKGFTLIEAMTGLALIAILASLAVPAFDHIRLSNQRSSAAQQLRVLLALARSDAVVKKRPATLCASRDGSYCVKNEARFFLVFSDSNQNRSADPGEIIRREAAVSDIRYEMTTSSLDSFRFRPDGTAMSYGNVVFCPSADSRYAAKLIINSMGRVRSARDSNGDGVIEDTAGRPLSCPG